MPPPKPGGRRRVHPVRESLNATCSGRRSGGAWRRLPRELPPWQTVPHDCRLWRPQGLWEKLPPALREAVRVQARREPQARAATIASQAVKTTGVGGRGDAGAKPLSGRQRHRLVETPGLVLRATVHRAAVPVGLAGSREEVPRLAQVWVNPGDTGSGTAWIEAPLGWGVVVGGHPPKPRGVWAPRGAVIDWEALRPKGFRGVLPRRWVVERTCSWCGQRRRLSQDDERRCATSEALIYVMMTRLMRRRLAHTRPFQTVSSAVLTEYLCK